MKRLILITLLFPLLSVAQKEANIWYFGNKAGLDFNSGKPVVLTDGNMSTMEGCATVSDANGDVLFYTNGIEVYNRNHILMPNGLGLLGNASSTQAAVIVKKPLSNTIYYIFTTDGTTGTSAGLHYSEVDISLNGWMGDLTANKNILVNDKASEKVCVVAHQNAEDFWIVTKLDEQDRYHSYLLTANGLSASAVVNSIGAAINLSSGYLKASSDGSRIVGVYNIGPDSYTAYADHLVELFDFDNTTGIFSNYISLVDPSFYSAFYGVEFSPNSQVLYVSDYEAVHQYNLAAGLEVDINNSRIALPFNMPSALQIAPDGKIYVAQDISSNTLGVINAPNFIGLACDYQQKIVAFPIGNYPNFGLPNFPNTYIGSLEFTSSHYCLKDTTRFYAHSNSHNSLLWNFGHPESGTEDTSTLVNPTHVYNKPGDYFVTLEVNYTDSTVVLTDTIKIRPNIKFVSDTVLCIGESVLFDVTESNATYLWNDGSTSATYFVNQAGTYTVEITVGVCTIIDTIRVSYNNPPDAFVDFSDTICEGEQWTYAPVTASGVAPYTIAWSDGIDTLSVSGNQLQIAATNPGSYALLSVHDADGCVGTVSGSANFLWYPSVVADFSFTPEIAFIDSTVVDLVNLSTGHIESYWNFGDSTYLNDNVLSLSHTYSQPDDYVISLFVINEYGCTDLKNNRIQIIPYEYFVPSAFTPNADGLNDVFNVNTTKVNAYEMEIYNRWGNVVYSTTNVLEPWDGTKDGIALEQGVYSYRILVIDPLDKLHKLIGHILLVR